jgi:hypothetical protein
MSATLYGTSGLTFGLTAETGGLVQSVEIKSSIDKVEAKNHEGETTGIAFHNAMHELTVTFLRTGGTGLGAATLAAAVTSANYTPAAGSLYCEEITDKRENKAYREITLKLVNHPLVV